MNIGIKPSSPPAVDAITNAIGAFGRYQLWIFILISFAKFFAAVDQMSILFLAPKLAYTCNGVNEGCPCTNPDYNKTIFTNTITMQWGLICERKWLISVNQTLYQLGVLIGSVIFGMASDRYGRKYPMICTVVLQMSSGVIAAFAPEYWSFTFIRFFTGASVGGSMVISFVILMEYIGTTRRELFSALFQAPFNVGLIMLPLFGYYFRDYFHFQLSVSIPSAILLCYFFLLPETPRWLIAVKRTEEAITLLELVAKVNKLPTQNIRADIEAHQVAMEKNKLKRGNILDLFRTPNLRKNILVMAFDWLACSYCFYGVSQYMGELSGDVFINSSASASITLLGTLLSIPLLKFTGRKNMVVVFNFICAFCLLVLAITPKGIFSVMCATVGVVASFIVFIVIYLYCSELFPTVVRNAAIGFSSMCARVGAMLAPFVVETEYTATWLPPVLFAVLPLLAGFMTFLLPETKGFELMTTIEEAEQFGKVSTHQTTTTSPNITISPDITTSPEITTPPDNTTTTR